MSLVPTSTETAPQNIVGQGPPYHRMRQWTWVKVHPAMCFMFVVAPRAAKVFHAPQCESQCENSNTTSHIILFGGTVHPASVVLQVLFF